MGPGSPGAQRQPGQMEFRVTPEEKEAIERVWYFFLLESKI